MGTTYENPNVTYEPSGQIGCGMLKLLVMYALFALLGGITVQVPVGFERIEKLFFNAGCN